VPVRGVFESINADVEWVPESKKVNVYKNDIVITLKINSNIAYINDNAVRLDRTGQDCRRKDPCSCKIYI